MLDWVEQSEAEAVTPEEILLQLQNLRRGNLTASNGIHCNTRSLYISEENYYKETFGKINRFYGPNKLNAFKFIFPFQWNITSRLSWFIASFIHSLL